MPSDPTISKVMVTPESVRGEAMPELIRDREKAARPKPGSGKTDQPRPSLRDTAS